MRPPERSQHDPQHLRHLGRGLVGAGDVTRVAALDRRRDLAAAIASAFFGTVLGAAFTAGFLAGRLTAPRRTP